MKEVVAQIRASRECKLKPGSLVRNSPLSVEEGHAELEVAASELLPLPPGDELGKAIEEDPNYYPVFNGNDTEIFRDTTLANKEDDH